jgi:hypothetical protein
MRLIRSASFFFLCLLVFAAPASAELVARGVQRGMLAVGPNGKPFVGYVRDKKLLVAERTSRGRWTAAKPARVAPGSVVMAVAIGAKGPAVLTMGPTGRNLFLVRRSGRSWQKTRLGRKLAAGRQFGWPGLAFDAKGLPVIAYTRWSSRSFDSALTLARMDAQGRIHAKQITKNGFPKSYAPPPAAPVLVGGKAHVIESYGYGTLVGTIEWYPKGKTWEGIFIDVGRGEVPVGPVFTRTRARTVYAAWSQSKFALGYLPVTLAVRAHQQAKSKYLLDRALTTGLALPGRRPEVAANEWVPEDVDDPFGDSQIWAGKIVSGSTKTELDGWIAGFGASPGGARQVLLARPGGLSWFRSPGRLGKRVSLKAEVQEDASVSLSGQVAGVRTGRITLYRERFGAARAAIARPSISGGRFSYVDRPPAGPFVYRAVYTDPGTRIPYAALLRQQVGSESTASAGGRPPLPRWLGFHGPVALGGELAVP